MCYKATKTLSTSDYCLQPRRIFACSKPPSIEIQSLIDGTFDSMQAVADLTMTIHLSRTKSKNPPFVWSPKTHLKQHRSQYIIETASGHELSSNSIQHLRRHVLNDKHGVKQNKTTAQKLVNILYSTHGHGMSYVTYKHKAPQGSISKYMQF